VVIGAKIDLIASILMFLLIVGAVVIESRSKKEA